MTSTETFLKELAAKRKSWCREQFERELSVGYETGMVIDAIDALEARVAELENTLKKLSKGYFNE